MENYPHLGARDDYYLTLRAGPCAGLRAPAAAIDFGRHPETETTFMRALLPVRAAMIVAPKPVTNSRTKPTAPPILGRARSPGSSTFQPISKAPEQPDTLLLPSDYAKLTHVPTAVWPSVNAPVILPANQRERRAAWTHPLPGRPQVLTARSDALRKTHSDGSPHLLRWNSSRDSPTAWILLGASLGRKARLASPAQGRRKPNILC